ncbi:type IV pilin [Halovenus sp. HT40]|uniref:type IV pilin n=1 Tax=Halovenus sp. HT40 TaxID=3126691 RepID=UPI00300ED798
MVVVIVESERENPGLRVDIDNADVMLDRLTIIDNDRAVSIVIGVISMIATVVVFAAVVPGFVFGIGDSVNESALQAQYEFNHDTSPNSGDRAVTIPYDGGEALSEESVGGFRVVVSGAATNKDCSLGENSDLPPLEVGDDFQTNRDAADV